MITRGSILTDISHDYVNDHNMSHYFPIVFITLMVFPYTIPLVLPLLFGYLLYIPMMFPLIDDRLCAGEEVLLKARYPGQQLDINHQQCTIGKEGVSTNEKTYRHIYIHMYIYIYIHVYTYIYTCI